MNFSDFEYKSVQKNPLSFQQQCWTGQLANQDHFPYFIQDCRQYHYKSLLLLIANSTQYYFVLRGLQLYKTC